MILIVLVEIDGATRRQSRSVRGGMSRGISQPLPPKVVTMQRSVTICLLSTLSSLCYVLRNCEQGSGRLISLRAGV